MTSRLCRLLERSGILRAFREQPGIRAPKVVNEDSDKDRALKILRAQGLRSVKVVGDTRAGSVQFAGMYDRPPVTR